MARPLRVEFPDATYLVTSRGIERRAIVVDDRDRDGWVDRLKRVVADHRWRLFAFALMHNHFHLFVRTPEGNLSRGMRELNGGHVSFFNARHQRTGHLFQGRFKAVLIGEESYWGELSRYVHLNPVRAGLAVKPEDWNWSSYVDYHRPARQRDWVDCAAVLEEFGGNTPVGHQKYHEFVEIGLDQPLDSPLSAAFHGFVLGSDQFVKRVQELARRQAGNSEAPQPSHLSHRPKLADVIAVVAEHYGSTSSQWAPGRRCDNLARSVAAYLGRRAAGASNRRIAEALGYRNPSSVSVACRRIERAPAESSLAKDVDTLTKRLETNSNHENEGPINQGIGFV